MHPSLEQVVTSDLDFLMLSPTIGMGRAISTLSSSDECMALAMGWIEGCTKNYRRCFLHPTNLPTRVINVGSQEKEPYLHISSYETVEYVALSIARVEVLVYQLNSPRSRTESVQFPSPTFPSHTKMLLS
jgi:hypothetical protein